VSSKHFILTKRAEEQHGQRHVYKQVCTEFEKKNQMGQNPKSGSEASEGRRNITGGIIRDRPL
jgi:hypothetical protein